MAIRKMFKRTGDPKKLEISLAPQEQVVFDQIPTNGIERKELVAKLEDCVKNGELKTKQAAASILGYYTKHLVDSKLIKIERIEEKLKENPEPKGKAAAKTAAKAAA